MPRSALLIVDVVNHFDFPGGARLAAATEAICAPLLALRDRFDAAGLPVVYANDNWTDWQGDFADLVASCRSMPGSPARIVGRLAPQEGHHYVLKPRHSAFMATALPVLLQQLQVERIVLAGIAADACILATALDAHMRGYRLAVPADCTAARAPGLKRAALHLLRHSCNADVRPARAIAVSGRGRAQAKPSRGATP
jgi:nicotinamidase-related amidase